MNTDHNPILVSGSHRSGTTWTGKMIAESPYTAYIYEPFNFKHRKPGLCAAPIDCWFKYICQENGSLFRKPLQDTLQFRYSILRDVKKAENFNHIYHAIKRYRKWRRYRKHSRRPLMKDPLALFSAGWLAEQFNMQVVILIRHPAAFTGSLKKADWHHPFADFLKQPLLMQHHLFPFEKDITAFAEQQKNIIDQAILLWNITHFMIRTYMKNNPDWFFIRHEDLSRNPQHEFEKIYRYLDLPFTEKIRSSIRRHSGQAADAAAEKRIARDSAENIWSWKSRLTLAEIQKIREGTHDIAQCFYSECDW